MNLLPSPSNEVTEEGIVLEDLICKALFQTMLSNSSLVKRENILRATKSVDNLGNIAAGQRMSANVR